MPDRTGEKGQRRGWTNASREARFGGAPFCRSRDRRSTRHAQARCCGKLDVSSVRRASADRETDAAVRAGLRGRRDGPAEHLGRIARTDSTSFGALSGAGQRSSAGPSRAPRTDSTSDRGDARVLRGARRGRARSRHPRLALPRLVARAPGRAERAALEAFLRVPPTTARWQAGEPAPVDAARLLAACPVG